MEASSYEANRSGFGQRSRASVIECKISSCFHIGSVAAVAKLVKFCEGRYCCAGESTRPSKSKRIEQSFRKLCLVT